jgi:GH15 family glucan-1,4-alpha-glucosidase
MYDVYGGTNLRERVLDHLGGYRGSRPVRIGNGAHSQLQLDVYGSVLSAALAFAEAGGPLGAAEARLLAGFGETAARRWREPDQGIWEIRGDGRHYTHSKVMCWLAVDSLIKLHERGCVTIDADRFRRERDSIAVAIETRGYDETLRSYVGAFETRQVDAALLLMGCVRYKDPSDARMRATFDRIDERLGRDGLLFRYEQGYDRMAAPEGAFGICSFWRTENLALRGDLEAAEGAFDRILSFANDVGLFGEEIDTGAALGNFPQAYTHVGLIHAAITIGELLEARTGHFRAWT